jgi:TolB-like protein/Flp pilus assembly protein TadD
MSNFFAELKRRNVYKVAVAYAVASWLLIQIATQVFPFFEIPNWAVRLVVLILIIGFPIALVLSWAFEITPEGIKRESEIQPDKSITHHTGRKIVALTIALAVIAAGLLAYQLWRPKRSIPTQTTALGESAGPIPEKSIAVLPFENLSDDKSNAYFAEGIQDEILTRLSKIAALKVISRTSTQKYKSAPENLRDVGKQLGVANLLEGSVQRIANAVHVNVQLIRATTDEHLWAESYNRKLDDVFGVEGEVATAIADQLNAKLSGTEHKAITEKPTQNTAAYDAYLRGLALEHNEYSYSAYLACAADYSEAVRLDPNFGIAWARLAGIRSFLYFNQVQPEANTAEAVKEAADRAIALAPDAGEAWVAQGAYRYRVLRDFAGALASYEEASKRLPNSSFVYQYKAFVQRRLGRWSEAEASYKKALELDPRDIQLLSSIANEFYTYLRRYDDAIAMANRAVEISPDSSAVHGNKASVLQTAGRLDEAKRELALVPTDATDPFALFPFITQAWYERRYVDLIEFSDRRFAVAPAGDQQNFFVLSAILTAGYCHSWLGHGDQARRAFERVLAGTKPIADANGSPFLPSLAYAGLGEKEKALAAAQNAINLYESDGIMKPAAGINLAQVQAQVGERDAAIAALPRLLEVPAGLHVSDLKFDPLWDPLRKDPRFQKLCEEKPK